MSKAGCPYDNAPMERFDNTFKSNFYNVTSFSNVEVMDELTTKYINWYNYVRPHSHNNYLIPMEARYKQVFIEQSVTKKLDQYILFDVKHATVSEHITNILASGELDETSVGFSDKSSVGRKPNIYNLDMILSVGYRVNSKKATRFRQWATITLKEYITKGFVLNDDMLKNGKPFGKDYFEELLERIREIRASERRAYQKITDVFEQCSYDYDKNSEITKNFYAFVQNGKKPLMVRF